MSRAPVNAIAEPQIEHSYVNDNGDTYDPPNDSTAQVLTAGKLGSTVYINSGGPRTM